jgi:hypothetical protein
MKHVLRKKKEIHNLIYSSFGEISFICHSIASFFESPSDLTLCIQKMSRIWISRCARGDEKIQFSIRFTFCRRSWPPQPDDSDDRLNGETNTVAVDAAATRKKKEKQRTEISKELQKASARGWFFFSSPAKYKKKCNKLMCNGGFFTPAMCKRERESTSFYLMQCANCEFIFGALKSERLHSVHSN